METVADMARTDKKTFTIHLPAASRNNRRHTVKVKLDLSSGEFSANVLHGHNAPVRKSNDFRELMNQLLDDVQAMEENFYSMIQASFDWYGLDAKRVIRVEEKEVCRNRGLIRHRKEGEDWWKYVRYNEGHYLTRKGTIRDTKANRKLIAQAREHLLQFQPFFDALKDMRDGNYKTMADFFDGTEKEGKEKVA
tara:strand:+ start:552 stop:1130 length:579 start_codon:yes stop_codon:yes gene_type:complete